MNLTTLLLVASVGMIVGAFLILRISPMDFTQGIFQRLTSAPKSIRSEINESTHRKKKSFLRREIEDAQTILKATGKEARFPMICAVSFLLFAIGAGIAIVMGNFFLVPVMAVGMMFIPFWYVKLTAGHFKKDVSSELETALSIISISHPVMLFKSVSTFDGYVNLMRFLSHAIHGQTAPWKRPQGRAAAPERGRSVGIGEPSPTSIFAELTGGKLKQKKQGVYHLALLASLCDPQDMVPPACAFAAKTDIRVSPFLREPFYYVFIIPNLSS